MSAPDAETRWTVKLDEDRYRRLLTILFSPTPDMEEGETR